MHKVTTGRDPASDRHEAQRGTRHEVGAVSAVGAVAEWAR
jgi:hypothetical protein